MNENMSFFYRDENQKISLEVEKTTDTLLFYIFI
jgi:hypothetical protein